MDTDDLSDIEIKADVFRIIRANTDKTPKEIINILKKHFSDIHFSKITKAVEELMND